MKADEIVEFVVRKAKKAGATDSVSQVRESHWSMIRFTNNGVTVSKVVKDTSVGIFLFIKEKRAGSVISNVSEEAIEKAVFDVAKMAKLSPSGGTYAPLPKGKFKYNKKLLEVGKATAKIEKPPEVVKDAIDSARSAGAARVAGSLTSETVRLTQRSSGGPNGSYRATSYNLNVRAFADGESTGQFAAAANSLDGLDGREIGRVAGDVAKRALNAEPAQPGKFDVVFGPMTTADLIEEMAGAASAFYVDAGMSFFTGKLSQDVAPSHFSLVDDATAPSSPGAVPFDDEGVPTQANPIVNNGKLLTFLHNSTTATKMKTNTTASAGLVIPKPFSLQVSSGNGTIEDLVSKVDEGLYVTNNWYLRYQNQRSGDFSTILRDGLFMIKHGQVAGPVRGLRLTDNLVRMLGNVEATGSKRYWIKWWEVDTPVLAPAMLVRGVRFTRPTI